ncbi:MAG: hypothetical protein D6698_04110, partial [Gammaproteobacteria bacterium]
MPAESFFPGRLHSKSEGNFTHFPYIPTQKAMSMALFSTFLLAAVISGSIIPGIIDFARERNLLERNDPRKNHRERVSSLGGIGIFAAFWLAAFVVMEDGFFAYGRYLFVAS